MIWIREFEIFVKRKLRQYFWKRYAKKDLQKLKKKNFVIISKNCWGGQFYQWLQKPYNSPFVGLFLFAPDYLKMLQNFTYYMAQPLNFIEESKYETHLKETYPIALLDDIEIHFQHYADEREAIEKWTRRKERMLQETNFDNYYFTICDRRDCTVDILKAFHDLPFKNKISFGLHTVNGLKPDEHIKVYDNPKQKRKAVHNGKKLFKLSFLYVDLIHWLNTGKVVRTRFVE
jgi:uncharacterized protein (DUF1919 family)